MKTNSKIRRACVACVKRIDDTLPQTDSAIVLTGLANHIKETLQNALSTPLRNCEVGSVKEQFARFRKFCKKGSMDSLAATAYCAYECPCGNSYDCKLAWAQMPYSEGGANG